MLYMGCYPQILESQMEKKVENDMETAIVEWFVAVGVSKNQGNHFEGHHIKGYSILKFILGPVSLWKLSCSDPYKYVRIYIYIYIHARTQSKVSLGKEGESTGN